MEKGGTQMKKSGIASFLSVWCIVLLAGAAYAEEKAPLHCTGTFEVGFRYVDVGGSGDKYKEDVNYTKGPRLFNLDLNLTPGPQAEQFFDLLNLNASNLGGDPYESFSFALKKYRKYNLRYTRNKLTYFYRDIIKLPDMTTSNLSDGGDFHRFNYDHVFHRMDFDAHMTDNTKVFFNFDRQYKRGYTTTTRDINRDEFELDKPMTDPRDDIKNDYIVGTELRFDKVSLYVDETYRDYENNHDIVLQGYSKGENPEDQTELLSYEQRIPITYKMPQTTVRANIRPNDRLTLNAGYVNTYLDSDLDYELTILGTNSQGNSISDTTSGNGDFTRKINLVNLDGTYDLNDWAALIARFSYKKFDQDGSLTIEEEETSVDGKLDSYDFDLGARVPVGDKVSVSGGVSHERRSVSGFHEEGAEEEEHEATKRNTLFVSAEAQLDPRVNVFGEYEHGFYDDPFTLISPSDCDRYKVRLRAKPTAQTNIVATFLRRQIKNDVSDADLSNNNISVKASYKMSPVKIYGAYTRMDIDNTVKHEIETLSEFWESLYEANTNQLLAGVLYDVHENLSLGFHTNVYKNTGSFGLDKQEYSVYSLLKCPAGYTVRIGYDRENYNEKDANFDDYNANIVSVGVGYGFGQP
jgi:hypothetical protein